MLQCVCESRLVTAGRTLYGASSFCRACGHARSLHGGAARTGPGPLLRAGVRRPDSGARSDFVVLDQTLFYAEGGGQPDDTGTLRWEAGEARVVRVTKEKGVVKHHVDRMPAAEKIHGVVDWDRRYKRSEE